MRYVAMHACRKFLAWKFGDGHPAIAAPMPKRRVTKTQRWLTPERAAELMESFPTHGAVGARDKALCALALDTGLRVTELCNLKAQDVDLEKRHCQAIIKGGDWGTGIFSEETAEYIRHWLTFRPRYAAPGIDNLFFSFQHKKMGQPLTREGVQGLCKRWGRRIGILLSPHDLRRSFAMISTLNGAPSRVVQVAGRWKHMKMLEHYTRFVDAEAIQKYLPIARLDQSSKE